MSKQKRQITIIGAGLTGALLGVLLGKRGYRVDLVERRPRQNKNSSDSGRSINLALSQRGIDALDAAGMMEAVRPILIPMKGRMLHLDTGRTEFSAYGHRPDEVIYSVSRRALNRLLVRKALEAPDVAVVFDQQLTDVNFAAATITLEDQTNRQISTKPFGLLIGADGAGSKVRRCLMEHTGGKSSSDFLEHNYKELEIPAGQGGSWQIEKEALHIWPRGDFMLIALPNLNGSFTATLFLPKQGNPGFSSLVDRETVNEFFETVFPSAKAVMPDLIEDFFTNPAGRLGTVRCTPWHDVDRCLIIGDAAHAIVPFHGQGMNCAFEDCSVLEELLNKFDDNWSHVAKAFSQTRKPDADAIADMAIENYTTMRETVTDPKYGLKKQVGFELERRMPDQYIPRYSMVMFHRMPYSEALRKGEIQKQVLDEITRSIDSPDDIDWDAAIAIVKRHLR